MHLLSTYTPLYTQQLHLPFGGRPGGLKGRGLSATPAYHARSGLPAPAGSLRSSNRAVITPVPVFELDFWTAAWLLVALALQHAAAAAGSRAGC